MNFPGVTQTCVGGTPVQNLKKSNSFWKWRLFCTTFGTKTKENIFRKVKYVSFLFADLSNVTRLIIPQNACCNIYILIMIICDICYNYTILDRLKWYLYSTRPTTPVSPPPGPPHPHPSNPQTVPTPCRPQPDPRERRTQSAHHSAIRPDWDPLKEQRQVILTARQREEVCRVPSLVTTIWPTASHKDQCPCT